MTLLVLAMVLAADAPQGEGPNPYLIQARELSQNLEFEKCLQRLALAPQWKSNLLELRDIELTAGLCHFNLGQKRDAAERFKLALRIDENAVLPEFSSPKAVELFNRMKRQLRGPPPPMPTSDLPDDAPLDLELEPKTPRPTVAADAHKVVWKDHPGPIALSVVSVAAFATGVGLGVYAKTVETKARAAQFESDFLALKSSAQGNALAANIALGVAGGALVVAVLWFVLEN